MIAQLKKDHDLMMDITIRNEGEQIGTMGNLSSVFHDTLLWGVT